MSAVNYFDFRSSVESLFFENLVSKSHGVQGEIHLEKPQWWIVPRKFWDFHKMLREGSNSLLQHNEIFRAHILLTVPQQTKIILSSCRRKSSQRSTSETRIEKDIVSRISWFLALHFPISRKLCSPRKWLKAFLIGRPVWPLTHCPVSFICQETILLGLEKKKTALKQSDPVQVLSKWIKSLAVLFSGSCLLTVPVALSTSYLAALVHLRACFHLVKKLWKPSTSFGEQFFFFYSKERLTEIRHLQHALTDNQMTQTSITRGLRTDCRH